MIRMEMKTEILPASDEKSIEKAAALLQNGELVALPTETVYGIAADAPMWPDFEEGWKVSRVLDAIALSHQEGRWLNVNDIV
mgnify:CR=1 FL=1